MQIAHKILPFEMKAASGDGATFEGYANAFHTIDSVQEIVAPGAFEESLPRFLAEGFIGGLNHNWDDPIGKPVAAQEDSKGLFVRGEVIDTTHGLDVRKLLKGGVIKKMSIGYRVQGAEMLETVEDVEDYWQQHDYSPNAEDMAKAAHGARLLTRLHLYEFSPVTVPANSMADITRVKRGAYDRDEIETERDFERFLRDAGYSRKEATAIASHGFKARPQRDAEELPTEPPVPAADAPPPAIEPEPEPVVPLPAPVVAKASQAEVQAAYLRFLHLQAHSAQLRMATR